MNSHGIDSVQIANDILDFTDGSVNRGMEAMVILRRKSKDGDVAVMLCQFLVVNQLCNRELGALLISLRNLPKAKLGDMKGMKAGTIIEARTLIQYLVTSSVG